MIRLLDVANELNISVATVSNAFTGKGRMTDETREEILEKAMSMGYVWTKKSSPSCKNRKNIIVIVESFSITFTQRILFGIVKESEKLDVNYPMFVLEAPEKDEQDVSIDFLSEKIDKIIRAYKNTIDGVIYISRYVRKIDDYFSKHNIHAVYVFCTCDENNCCIHYDDYQGAYTAVEHLVKKGKKNIAMLSGPINSIGMFHRSTAYQRVLIDNSLEFNPTLVCVGDWTKDNAYELSKKLLISNKNVDSIFVQNDYMALGALEAINELGLNCPKDIAIVGFDNTYSKISNPKITTIAPPFHEMGKNAVIAINKMVNGEKVTKAFLPCELVQRESS